MEVNAALQMGVAATVIVDANLNKILSGDWDAFNRPQDKLVN